VKPEYFREKTKISDFMKIHPVGTEFYCTDGQTDKAKPIIAFRNFANETKNRWREDSESTTA
jgi:hypothetical protein